MSEPKLEQVFKLSGMPEITFVKPIEYDRLLVSIRSPGRGVVVEGPSGIGKTTAVLQALNELGIGDKILKLSARKHDDIEMIAQLHMMGNLGIVIVDDFHRLDPDIKKNLADLTKTLADEERPDTKLIIIGIPRAGRSLFQFGIDLVTRLDVIQFEANPAEKVQEIPNKGQSALNISFNTISEIVASSNGSFYIAQMLCHESCLSAGILEAQEQKVAIETSFELIRNRVLNRLAPKFHEVTISFATGPQLRREGRAPYLHILKWLAEANEWTIQIDRKMITHPDQRGSVGQVIEKGYLYTFIAANPNFSEIIHYDSSTQILAVQDPQFVYYLRNLPWNAFTKEVGYLNIKFPSKYDFALSFSGTNRSLAEMFFTKLCEFEFQVFYDKNEQHRMLAEDIEEYLAPIYRSEAEFVICLLSSDYPKRIWTKFESEQFKDRFKDGEVIPVWFSDAPVGIFDETSRKCGFTYDPKKNMESQVTEFVEILRKKVSEKRMEENS